MVGEGAYQVDSRLRPRIKTGNSEQCIRRRRIQRQAPLNAVDLHRVGRRTIRDEGRLRRMLRAGTLETECGRHAAW